MAGKTKKDLSSAIGNLTPEIPQLRRGEGVKLSTEETVTQTPPPQIVKQEEKTVQVKTEQVERIKPGYSLRKDLIKECKRIAWETVVSPHRSRSTRFTSSDVIRPTT